MRERENVISEDSGNNDFSRSKIVEKRSYILRAAEVGSSDGQRRVRRDDVRPRYVKPLPPTRPSTRALHRLSHLVRFHIHIARAGRVVRWCSSVGSAAVAIVVVPSQSPEAPSDGWQRWRVGPELDMLVTFLAPERHDDEGGRRRRRRVRRRGSGVAVWR